MKPVLLDLCCKGGGVTRGYQLAGFDVDGVDIEPQPRYRGDSFYLCDALEFLRQRGKDYDAIHASPPCQEFCSLKHLTKKEYPNLIGPIRELLIASGKPYIIENVEGARKFLHNPAMLCGTMFGLQTECGAQLRRHRLFETNWPLRVDMECAHWKGAGKSISVIGSNAEAGKTISVCGHSSPGMARTICVNGTGMATSGGATIGVYGTKPKNEQGAYQRRTISITGSTPQTNVERNKVRECFTVEQARVAMGIDWMTMKELSQAIPPAYTEYVGLQLREYLSKA